MLIVSMKVSRAFRVSVALLAILGMTPPLYAQIYEGRELVKPKLVTDTDAIIPGKPFTVALLLRMMPHWHTYWKYSGDAGLPTEIKWHLPVGWKVSEIQWPIPFKTKDPGDIETYGYENEVMLMQQVTPPAHVSDASVKLSADANWLVCEKICIPGTAQLSMTLPIATTNNPANAELFDRYRKLLPKSWPSREVATAKWSRTGSDLHLQVRSDAIARYAMVDFFPAPPPEVVVGHPSIESRSGSEIAFKIPLQTSDKNLSSLSGLVVFASDPNWQGRTAWTISRETEPASVAAPAATRGLVTFLFFGIIGGFILNLMPCVLPVISLKIFGFLKQAGEDRARILRSGLAFTAGIFAWFIVLALVLIALKAAGRDATWGGFQFTNAYFVLVLSVIVLVFALNLFGVFEISLPQSMTRGLLATSERKDDLGSFFQGVFATVLATPCTAPFLGTALGFAFTQPPPVILLIFVAIATGMSAPYLLLSAQPGWLRFLPKPGPWMLHVKQLMGFLLLATLLFLVYVLGAQRGLEGAIWASCFLLMVAIACWIKGAFMPPGATVRARVVARLLIIALVVGSGVYCIGDKFRAATIDLSQGRVEGGWQPFTPERLQAELAQGHAVFVDFTAAWCLTCKFNEKTVLESAPVREAFQRRGVIKLKADWTNGDPAITKLLQQFRRPGVPLYVLYPGNSENPIVFPELLTQRILLDKLESITTVAAIGRPGEADLYPHQAGRGQ
jgi:thiol:disulfide interchange protein